MVEGALLVPTYMWLPGFFFQKNPLFLPGAHTPWAGPLFLPPKGSLKMLDSGLCRIFDVKTRGDARTLQ